jgi:hypothetical protein
MNQNLLNLSDVRTVIPGSTAGPAVIEAPHPGCTLADWLSANAETVWGLVAERGALLLRGFTVASPTEFEHGVMALKRELQPEYGDLPHAITNTQFVQDATPYPAELAILFHHEASHTPLWPRYIWFFCEQPAHTGGETPLLRSEEIARRLPPAILAEFSSKGLTYIRSFLPGLDVPWQTFFRTDDTATVEQICQMSGVNLHWLPNGGLRTMTNRPAVIEWLGRPLFFNQLLLHHPACLAPATRQTLADLFGVENLPRNVTFGDGSPIPDPAIEVILETAVECGVCFEWRQGDVLMLDNLAVSHARRPYSGPRCIRVAMSAFVSDRQAQEIAHVLSS